MEKIINKRKEIIKILRDNQLDFNAIFILECFLHKEEKQFFDMFEVPSIKDFFISAGYQALQKSQYLVKDPNNSDKIIISTKGKELLADMQLALLGQSKVVVSPTAPKTKTPEECFEEWWKAYPTTPAWKSDDGKEFIGSRSLKNLTKAKAKEKYLILLNQGLKHEELLGGLQYEIKLKKIDSVKKNENQMDFFKGMESYLNQGRYLLFIDSYRDNPDFVTEKKTIIARRKNVVDI